MRTKSKPQRIIKEIEKPILNSLDNGKKNHAVKLYKARYGFHILLDDILMTNKSNNVKKYWRCSLGCGAKLKRIDMTETFVLGQSHSKRCLLNCKHIFSIKMDCSYIGEVMVSEE